MRSLAMMDAAQMAIPSRAHGKLVRRERADPDDSPLRKYYTVKR